MARRSANWSEVVVFISCQAGGLELRRPLRDERDFPSSLGSFAKVVFRCSGFVVHRLVRPAGSDVAFYSLFSLPIILMRAGIRHKFLSSRIFSFVRNKKTL